MKYLFFTVLILLEISMFSQNITLKETNDFLKEKIESMCTQFGSTFYAYPDSCSMDIYETMNNNIDTVNFYHIEYSGWNDTTLYSPKEKLGTTYITLKCEGCYFISFYNVTGVITKKRTSNTVSLAFKTKGIDRIAFVNKIDAALTNAKNHCKSRF